MSILRISSYLLLLGLLSAAACSSGSKSEAEKPVLSVSILPQEYFIRELAGELVEVNVMIPEGGSPATYEPGVGQLARLNRSSYYLRIGHVGFEKAWMDKIKSASPALQVVDLSEGIALISGNNSNDDKHEHVGAHAHQAEHTHADEHGHLHGGVDPHIWLSVRNARILAKNTHAALVRVLPEYRDSLDARLKNLDEELRMMDEEITALLADAGSRTFMIYHPALAYFARDYNLVQYSLEKEGKEPSPAHMKELADLGRELGISTIFVQREFDLKNAEVLANEMKARVQVIDPLDAEWKQQLHTIAHSLKESMQ